jgi:hypothetical protein
MDFFRDLVGAIWNLMKDGAQKICDTAISNIKIRAKAIKDDPETLKKMLGIQNESNKLKKLIPFFIALIVIIVLPIKMGIDANKKIPIIGYIETISKDYCDETFKKATATFVALSGVDAAISILESLDIKPMGVGISIGKMLSPAHDTIKQLKLVLGIIIGAMLAGKLTIGLLSFICIKLMLATATILKILHISSQQSFLWADTLSKLMTKMAIFIWLLFPVGAAMSTYIQSAYTNNIYEVEMNEIGAENGRITELSDTISSDFAVSHDSSKNATSKETKMMGSKVEEKSFFDSVSDKVVSVKDSIPDFSISAMTEKVKETAEKVKVKVNSVISYANNIIIKGFQIITIFILTTFIVPLAVLFIFYSLAKSVMAQADLG